jgi:hypothetical protein
MSAAVNAGITASQGKERPAQAPARDGSGFIIGPMADCVFIIGAPLLALLIALPLFSLDASRCSAVLAGKPVDLRQVFLLSFTMAHLVLVFFRSHANTRIFWTHPLRFTLVPAALLVTMASSIWAYALVVAIGVWWDVYHSSLQTFGFGRIYDAKRGNKPDAGRNLDIGMNLFLYLGPVLAGAQFATHVDQTTNAFTFLDATDNPLRALVLQQAPSFLKGNQWYLTVAVLTLGGAFLLYYLWSYHRLNRRGNEVSWQKVSLLVITGCVSIYVWGFRSFFDAFWVMNFFHALQYFAIVFYTERTNLARLFRVDRFALGMPLVLMWIVVLTFQYGVWATYYARGAWMNSAVITVAIMHFWYDGFIWSVQKKQV